MDGDLKADERMGSLVNEAVTANWLRDLPFRPHSIEEWTDEDHRLARRLTNTINSSCLQAGIEPR